MHRFSLRRFSRSSGLTKLAEAERGVLVVVAVTLDDEVVVEVTAVLGLTLSRLGRDSSFSRRIASMRRACCL